MHKLEYLGIAVIGLGYVGLPLAVEFGKSRTVLGFDINENRIQQLRRGQDATLQVSAAELESAVHLKLSADPKDLDDCNCFIVTVPTPIDASKRPDLRPPLERHRLSGSTFSKVISSFTNRRSFQAQPRKTAFRYRNENQA